MSYRPFVSIIVPCYNQGKFLNEALDSIYNQTYINWECIIVNDGSRDHSEEIANKWVAKDDRFKYFFKENSGVSASRNLALNHAKGAFIQFLDADDFLESRKLELSLKVIGSGDSIGKTIVFTNFMMFINDPGTTKAPYCLLEETSFTYKNLLYKWNDNFSIPIHCGLFEASLFNNIRFPENLTAQEDWLVWVKIFKLGVRTIFLDKPLALYRQNPESRTNTMSIIEDQMTVFTTFKVILNEEEFYKLSKTLLERSIRVQSSYVTRFNTLKKSYPYQTGLMIKKVLKSIGLLKLARRVFPFFLRFKS